MESLWRKETEHFSSALKIEDILSSGKTYEVIVAGAGLAGLLTAYYLKEQGIKVLVLEADEIASGQTEGTTAKITSQHGLKYSRLIEDIGTPKARLYAQANESAIREYERLIQTQNIDCEFERVSAYLYSLEDEKQLIEEAEAARLLGIDAYFTKEIELPFPVKGAVCFRGQAQFSPLKFIRYLIQDLEIAEHVKVISVKGNKVITDKGEIMAEKIIIATHYPILNIPGFYFLRQHQERSYVLALSGCPKVEGMYYGVDKGGLSFRQAGDFLLLGGRAHRTGENICGGRYKDLAVTARYFFPECKEAGGWSAQDCMTHDGIPFIGKYSVFTPDIYVITGFGKWGMTSAMISAMILRDELCGVENVYEELFRPQRILFKAAYKNFVTDVGMSLKGLARGWLGKSKRCAHMGCGLVWNPDENSWECPCHGSRFDPEGNLLGNPSKKDISIK